MGVISEQFVATVRCHCFSISRVRTAVGRIRRYDGVPDINKSLKQDETKSNLV